MTRMRPPRLSNIACKATSGPQLAEPALEEATLRLVTREPERPPVCGPGLVGATEATKQLGAGRVQILLVLEREGVDDRERRLRPVDLGDRNGTVQLDDR
jgi:hypothetical protein